jgi:hypothetical protein
MHAIRNFVAAFSVLMVCASFSAPGAPPPNNDVIREPVPPRIEVHLEDPVAKAIEKTRKVVGGDLYSVVTIITRGQVPSTTYIDGAMAIGN